MYLCIHVYVLFTYLQVKNSNEFTMLTHSECVGILNLRILGGLPFWGRKPKVENSVPREIASFAANFRFYDKCGGYRLEGQVACSLSR